MSLSARVRDEEGAATGVALVVTALLVLLAVGAALGARVLVGHRAAGAVADLSALAGAVAVQHGRDGCAEARRHAQHSGARPVRCRVEGQRVRLTVSVPVTLVGGREITVSARAHAGPR